MRRFRPSLTQHYLSSLSGRPETLVLLLWMAINAYFLIRNGVVTSGEAEKYIRQAHIFIQTGHPETRNFWLYFIQIALLSLCLKAHLGFVFALSIQLLFNFLATFYFFKTVSILFDSGKIALVATILLLLDLPYQEFNVYLQTESLFQSFSLLLSCYILRIERISTARVGFILLSLFILSVTRPIGILYIPAAFFYLSFFGLRTKGPLIKIAFFSLSSLVFLYLLDKAMNSGGELDFMLPFREEHIICGCPTVHQARHFGLPPNSNALFSLIFYILHYFRDFSRLAALKTLAFWGLFRTYYSFSHNLALMAIFYPLSLMSFFGIFSWARKFPFGLLYLLSVVLLTWATVILTCDDWHNRLYLSISPYIILLSLPFMQKLPALRPALPRPASNIRNSSDYRRPASQPSENKNIG